MTIALVGVGLQAQAGGATPDNDPTPPLPTGFAAGNMLLAFGGAKPFDTAFNAISGWSIEYLLSDDTSAPVVDNGGMCVIAYSREAAGGELDPTLSNIQNPQIGANVVIAFCAAYSKDSSKTWDVVSCGKPVGTGTVTKTFAFDTDPGIAAGDVLIFTTPCSSDSGSQAWNSITVPGCVLGTPVQIANYSTAQGGDCRIRSFEVPVVSGASTGTSTVVLDTSGAGNRGLVGSMLRLREVATSQPEDSSEFFQFI